MKKIINKKGLDKKDILIIFIIMLLVLLLGGLSAIHYSHLFKGREVLKTAKLVRLTILADSYEYYGQRKSIIDNSEKSHLRSNVEDEVLKSADASGNIQYVAFGKNQVEVTEMVYTEDGYAVRFQLKEDEPVWTVYRLDEIVKY